MSLESVPTYLSDFLNINVTVAEVLLSLVVLLTFLLPIMVATRGKTPQIYLFFFFLIETFLLAIGWLDFWIYIMTVSLIALAVAIFGRQMVLGS